MKKIYFALLLLPLLALWGCSDKEEIVFEHEKPQFETRSDAILLEVILPYGTASDDAVYIAGPATGFDEESVPGRTQWQLTPSDIKNKYGIYIYPADLAEGKTLADGYYFVSLREGREMSIEGEEVIHTETAAPGERAENIWVRRWLSYFMPPEPSIWPDVPGDRIQLRFNVPDYTPTGYSIRLVGNLNGWDSGDSSFDLVALDATHYYINLDPAGFSDGKTLADEFKVSVLVPGQEWWYHESNEDGSGAGGQGFTVESAITGRGYELDVLNWRNSGDLPAGIPAVPADKFMLMITVPDYTPENSLIGLFGEWNGWGGMLDDRESWTAVMFTPDLYYLVVDPARIADGKTLKDMFHITLYYETSTDGNWWKHQANEDGSGDEGPGINNSNNDKSPRFDFELGKTYNITVNEWRNSDDIKNSGTDPEDLSVRPWKGLEVEAGKILLQIEVPGGTPDNSAIALCGNVSGWGDGADNLDSFGATRYSGGMYYIMLDPADFAPGTSLADEFKFGLLQTGRQWWEHESEAAFRIPGSEAGKAYTVTVPGWRDADQVEGYITYPEVPEDKYVIHLFVPDNTPDDAVIAVYGDINNWDGADLSKWGAARVAGTRYVLNLDPADFAPGTGLTQETTDNGFQFAILAEGKEWWYFQSDDGNMLLRNGIETGTPYNVTVTAWKNAGEL